MKFLRLGAISISFINTVILASVLIYLLYSNLICGWGTNEMIKGIFIAVLALIILYSLWVLITEFFWLLLIVFLIAVLFIVWNKIDYSGSMPLKWKTENQEHSWKGGDNVSKNSLPRS